MTRVERIGDATLYRADCIDLLDQFDRSWAVVSDPPYGMNWDTKTTRFSGGRNPCRRGAGRHDDRAVHGDHEAPDLSPFLAHKEAVIWGMNHFCGQLAPGGTLVWLKRNDQSFGSFLSDAELAWVKGRKGVFCRRDMSMNAITSERAHPTQKPISLMEWCLSFVKADTVLDPYMGSGSTALACIKQGRRFIGVEIDPGHFETACRRIEAAYKQPDLFIPAPAAKPEQKKFAV